MLCRPATLHNTPDISMASKINVYHPRFFLKLFQRFRSWHEVFPRMKFVKCQLWHLTNCHMILDILKHWTLIIFTAKCLTSNWPFKQKNKIINKLMSKRIYKTTKTKLHLTSEVKGKYRKMSCRIISDSTVGVKKAILTWGKTFYKILGTHISKCYVIKQWWDLILF